MLMQTQYHGRHYLPQWDRRSLPRPAVLGWLHRQSIKQTTIFLGTFGLCLLALGALKNVSISVSDESMRSNHNLTVSEDGIELP